MTINPPKGRLQELNLVCSINSGEHNFVNP